MAVPSVDFDRVEAREVSRYYGRRRALAKVSITCQRGSITGLFGPNGSGKSTLLAVLSTLMRATSGEVRYGDRDAAGWGDRLRSRIGVLGHDLFLYGDLTARENLEFFGRLYGLDDLDGRIAAALAAGRLAERGADRTASFSRGMRQRLALERALLHGPRLVLLDEPFTGLDDESAALLGGRLRTLRDAGAIVILATHDFESAEGLVDQAVCLREGRLALIPDGTGRLRDRYRAVVSGVEAGRSQDRPFQS